MNNPSLSAENVEKRTPDHHVSLKQVLQKQIFRVIHYWFIRYNPLYFFSAFCVLLGILLITNSLVVEVEEKNWTYAHILLVSVVQLYELLMIASIVFLVKGINQYRPAVFLILLELFFLADCTFRIETLSGLGTVGILFIVLWVILAVFKLAIISWALQLHQAMIPLIIDMLAILGIAVSPFWFMLPHSDSVVMYLLVNWYGIMLIMLIFFLSPLITCDIKLDLWGQTVLRRAVRASWMIIIGLYFYHLINRLVWFEHMLDFNESEKLILFMTQIIPLLMLIGILTNREKEIWVSGITVIICATIYPPTIPVSALMVAVIWGMQGWRMEKPNLYFGALLALYSSLWILGPHGNVFPYLPPLVSLANGILIGGLVLLILKWQLKAAMFLLSIIAIGGILSIGWHIWPKISSMILLMIAWLRNLFPHSVMGWGIFLLGSGFIALIAGVMVSWSQGQAHLKKEKMESSS